MAFKAPNQRRGHAQVSITNERGRELSKSFSLGGLSRSFVVMERAINLALRIYILNSITILAIIEKATRSGSGMHWRDYHSLESIYAFMREIRARYPNICRLYTIGQTTEGRDLKVLR